MKRKIELKRFLYPCDKFLFEANGIIHIGAHHAEERYLYEAMKKRVLWIEANPDHLCVINANLRGFVRQKAFIGLLGSNEQEKQIFNVSNNDGLSSSVYTFEKHSDLWPEVKMVKVKTLPQTTLDAILKKNKEDSNRYDTLVLDTQGSELDILKGISNLNKWIKRIQLETSNFNVYKNAPLKKAIDAFLFSKGYVLLESQVFNSSKDKIKKCMNCRYIIRKQQK